MPIRILSMLVVALVAAGSQRAQASPQRLVEGVHFAESLQIQDVQLTLRGAGLLRYMIFIKVYVGALYLPPETRNADVLEAVPRRLEFSYFHAIQAQDLARSTHTKIADNVSAADLAALEPRLDEFNSLYRNIDPGDRYGLTYIPGRGTELDLNGQILGLVAGDDFARAVFAIWLGRNPIDADFKAALLGAV